MSKILNCYYSLHQGNLNFCNFTNKPLFGTLIPRMIRFPNLEENHYSDFKRPFQTPICWTFRLNLILIKLLYSITLQCRWRTYIKCWRVGYIFHSTHSVKNRIHMHVISMQKCNTLAYTENGHYRDDKMKNSKDHADKNINGNSVT